MRREYTYRPKADLPRLTKRILKLTAEDAELSPEKIAKLCRCSHCTVRKVQRAAGVYVERGAGGKKP
jgi:DeoR/GlpR family transcriptional regulator of sugar metabolism